MVDTFNRLLGATSTTVAKSPVRAASTSNLDLSGYQTIDGVTFGASDVAAGRNMRVLVWQQTDAKQNGIYLVNSGVWTRTPDFDGNTDFVQGSSVLVTSGTVYAHQVFIVTSADPQSVGINSISLEPISSFPISANEVSALWFMSGSLAHRVVTRSTTSADAVAVTAAINAAIDATTTDGGIVNLPAGTYPLTYAAASGSQHTAVMMKNNVWLKGSGRTVTSLKLINGANCHSLYGRDISDVIVSDIEIDGNRANVTNYDPANLGVAPVGLHVGIGTSERLRFSNLYIHDTYDYGIGVQINSGHNCIFEHIKINNAGSDGLDFKNYNADSYGHILHNISVDTFGLQGGATAETFAGIDLAGRIQASKLRVYNVGYGRGGISRTGIRFNHRDIDGTHNLDHGGSWSGIDGFLIVGSQSDTNDTYCFGLDVQVPYARIQNGHIEKMGTGIVRRGASTFLSNITVQDSWHAGLWEYWGSLDYTHPGQATASGLSLFSGASGISMSDSTANNTYQGVHLNGNTVNLVMGENCVNNTFIGGSNLNSVSAKATIPASSVGNNFFGVSGYKTSGSAISSSTIDLTSVGVTSISIDHGLDITPDISKVQLTILCNNSSQDWDAVVFARTPTSSSQVSCKVRVIQGSVTGGTTGNVLLTVAP